MATKVLPKFSSVCFLGLGRMGSQLAKRTRLTAGETLKSVRVWNRTTSVAQAHASSHGTLYFSSLCDAVEGADVIVSMLPTSTEVRQVVDSIVAESRDGCEGEEKPQASPIWIDCTSGDPKITKETSLVLKNSLGIEMVDCAVSGGPAGAIEGTLTGMVGGDRNTVELVRPIISLFCKDIFYLGPCGSGHAVKAVNNALLAAHLILSSEAMVTLAKSGAEVETALAAINRSSGRNFVLEGRFPNNILTRKFDYGFTMEGLLKDIRNGCTLSTHHNIYSPLLQEALALTIQATDVLGPSADHTEIVKFVEAKSGAEGLIRAGDR